MNKSIESRLKQLREDYTRVTGRPFFHFFCPILYKDEDVPLCKGHIVNQAFKDSPRDWTIQRKDVDAFYGSRFESDFVDIQLKGNHPLEILVDKSRSKRFSPKIYLEKKPVEFFPSNSEIPDQFTPVTFDGTSVLFGLKMRPDEAKAAEGKHWEIEVSRDLRLPALVSAIKAAHLTLFHLLGYRYALSMAGYFVGRQILGEFFLQNQEKSKSEVLANAHSFFREYLHMVRPGQSCGFDSHGSVRDQTFLTCIGSSGLYWALVVFVKTGEHIQGVLMPVFRQPDQAATFLEFLRNDTSSIQAAACYFRNDSWEISTERKQMDWPKDGTLWMD